MSHYKNKSIQKLDDLKTSFHDEQDTQVGLSLLIVSDLKFLEWLYHSSS